MNEQLRNFMVGLTAALALIGLAALLMFFGELRLFRPPQYAITIHMNITGGIREGSPIELNGVRIGEIERIRLHSGRIDFPVEAIAGITKDKRIPESVSASVDRSLLAGTAILQLTTLPPPPGDDLTYIPDDGTGELQVVAQTVVEQILAELDARTEPLMNALESFNRLSETFVALGENLNALIGEAAYDADPETLVDTATLRAAVARLNTTLEQATHMFSRYSRLADSIEEDASSLIQSLLPVTDELAAALDDVRRMMRLATDGRGTVAQLLNNPDLYESLLDASIRLERALTEAQLLIQKFQAEGVPVRW